jgi:Domain of unknown function (DUF4281)
MTPHSLFPLANSVAALGWLILLLAPLASAWPRRMAVATALALAMTYAALIGAFISQGTGDFQSLAGVARLFEHPGLLLAGWVHYLAFDLLIGLWEREEAARIGLSRWWLLPCQWLTFLFGPLGWLAFMATRWLHVRGGRSTGAGGPSPRVLAL